MVDSKENYRFDLEVKGLKSICPEIIYKPWQRYISQKCQHEQHTRSTTTVFLLLLALLDMKLKLSEKVYCLLKHRTPPCPGVQLKEFFVGWMRFADSLELFTKKTFRKTFWVSLETRILCTHPPLPWAKNNYN